MNQLYVGPTALCYYYFYMTQILSLNFNDKTYTCLLKMTLFDLEMYTLFILFSVFYNLLKRLIINLAQLVSLKVWQLHYTIRLIRK